MALLYPLFNVLKLENYTESTVQCQNQVSDCETVCPSYSDFLILLVFLCVCSFRSIQCFPVCTWLYQPVQPFFTSSFYNYLHLPLTMEPLFPHVEMKLYSVVMQSSETESSLQISFCGIPDCFIGNNNLFFVLSVQHSITLGRLQFYDLWLSHYKHSCTSFCL